jgi:hypothetical protein
MRSRIPLSFRRLRNPRRPESLLSMVNKKKRILWSLTN